MGRSKIEIKKIEKLADRVTTYSERSKGLLKKARELATLCDIHLLVIMFSEAENLTTYCSSETTIEQVLRRLANTLSKEQTKTQAKTEGILAKTMPKLNAESKHLVFGMPTAKEEGLAMQTALATKEHEIEELKRHLEQVQRMDNLTSVQVEQSGSIVELNHLENLLKTNSPRYKKRGATWKRLILKQFLLT